MMARSDLLHERAGYRRARPVAPAQQIQLATHGRSIQTGHEANTILLDHHVGDRKEGSAACLEFIISSFMR